MALFFLLTTHHYIVAVVETAGVALSLGFVASYFYSVVSSIPCVVCMSPFVDTLSVSVIASNECNAVSCCGVGAVYSSVLAHNKLVVLAYSMVCLH